MMEELPRIALDDLETPDLDVSADFDLEGAQAADSGVSVVSDKEVEVPVEFSIGPSAGKAFKKVSVPAGFRAREFHEIVAATYQVYIDLGQVIDIGEIQKYVPKIPKSRIELIMGTEEFQLACDIRGIVVGVNPAGLTPEQSYALTILMDPSDRGTLQQKLRRAGISMAKYNAWRKQPVFKSQVDRISNAMLRDNLPDMITQLTGKAVQGDLNAIKFAFEVSGHHDPARQNNVNVMSVLMQVMEIIQQNVRDPEALRNIATEMQNIAGQLGVKQINQ